MHIFMSMLCFMSQHLFIIRKKQAMNIQFLGFMRCLPNVRTIVLRQLELPTRQNMLPITTKCVQMDDFCNADILSQYWNIIDPIFVHGKTPTYLHKV